MMMRLRRPGKYPRLCDPRPVYIVRCLQCGHKFVVNIRVALHFAKPNAMPFCKGCEPV